MRFDLIIALIANSIEIDSIPSSSSKNSGITEFSLNTMANMISYAGFAIGLVLLIMGIFQFISAARVADAEGKSKASRIIIVGLVLVSIGGVLQVLLHTVLK